MRAALLTLSGLLAFGARMDAQHAAAPAHVHAVTDAICAAPLGQGVKTQRTFCDVVITTDPLRSVSMTIPKHIGPATMTFDLHNRFMIPVLAITGPLVFARHEATVAVVRPGGVVLGRAGVIQEFRSVADLFDEISGGERTGGVKAVAPGIPESAKVTIPAGVSTVGVVGLRLAATTRTGEETFDTPGRPVAIVSNLRIEYRSAR